MFSNNLIAGVSGQSSGGYAITDSLRFNDDDSAYLSRTPASAGDRKTWTWSGWVKRGNLGTGQNLFGSGPATNSYCTLGFTSGNVLSFQENGSSSNAINVTTPALFRDVSGWYHIVLSVDTTQATNSNGIRIYVNGIQQTLTFSTYTQNTDTLINSTSSHVLGDYIVGGNALFDGYMAEVNFIDGQALTADDFGEINADTGEWSPKRYLGTYGTNGFYLEFKDGAALGDDTSGNTNDWTPTNLASTDQMLDTPTNNFATLNPLAEDATYASPTTSNGNLDVSFSSTTTITSTIGVSSGKWYYEQAITSTPSSTTSTLVRGIKNFDLSNYTSFSWRANGGTQGLTGSPTLGTYTNGDTLGIAVDVENAEVTFYKNGVLQGSGAYSYTTFDETPLFLGGYSSGTATVVWNFGQDSSFAGNKTRQGNTDANGIGDFYYTPPAGYSALCTDNLAEPTIVDSETQFNAVTYTGTGTTLNVTGVGFQPDLVWMKRRNSANTHDLIDVVRGDTARLFSDLTDAELSDVTFSFDSDGFSPDPTKANENAAGGTYVAWCWKAGGTAVTNTDGAITSQVSANVDAGFSIVGYTATNSSSNVGHGLSQAPELIISKRRTAVSSWMVYTTVVDGSYDYLFLNNTNAKANSVLSAPTTSVIYVTNTESAGTNVGTDTYITYCFHSVEGFSKIGTYVGNGSADGPFIYTGFRPAFILMKRTDAVASWHLFDNERSGYNAKNDFLLANLADTEYSGTTFPRFDLLSNGFKAINSSTNTNASGSTYIYMAFAEAPFKEALAR